MPRFTMNQVGPDIDLDEEEIYLDDGTRLSEAAAEQLGVELAERARRGRPSISGEKRTPNLTVRVDPGTRTALEAIAEKQGRRLADVSREALDEYVTRHAG
jgi:hypothetical protein